MVKTRTVARAALALALAIGGAGALVAAEAPIDLKWDQLIPPAPPKPRKPSFLPPTGPFDISSANDDGTPAPMPTPEARWMSVPRKSREPAPVVQGLDGKRVHIGGYVVPLDFDATNVKEFLLVPFVGACIHVPAPPGNQIVYVKTEKGFDVQGSFDPVYVTGTLKVTPAYTGLAEAGYSLEAEKVEAAPQ